MAGLHYEIASQGSALHMAKAHRNTLTIWRVEYTNLANSATVEGFSSLPAPRRETFTSRRQGVGGPKGYFSSVHMYVERNSTLWHLSLLKLPIVTDRRDTRPCVSQSTR